ncbi:MAG: response regulator transcription factor [Bacteroidia bacterium]|jgi:DNA-binding response OmpR family regulator
MRTIGSVMLNTEPHAQAGSTRPRSAPARLVLFVGAELRPDSALSDALGRDGVRCLWLAGTEQAVRAARLAHFDAVVIDGTLVDGAAGHTLAEMRVVLHCPVLVLADGADEIDEIVALELGADAFLVQPVLPRRLRAHLAALMRRPPPRSDGGPSLTRAGWTLEPLRRALVDGSREVPLTEAQSLLLQCLFDAGGALVARARLLAALPHGEALRARSVDVYISRLRQRLRDEGVAGFAIEAVRGRGFVLRSAGPVPAQAPAQAQAQARAA